MKKRFNKGYSVETAEEYIDVNEEVVCVSKGDLINKYDNEKEKYTDEISHQTYWFSQEGLTEPFKVKFEDINLKISQFSNVKLIGLTACEIQKKVYFKAEGIEVIK